jgi:hypothetical protein
MSGPVSNFAAWLAKAEHDLPNDFRVNAVMLSKAKHPWSSP